MVIESRRTSADAAFPADGNFSQEWQAIIASAGETLRALAGTTENEFLQIGSQLQDFYQRSSEVTSMANRLADLVSGEQVQSLIDQLRRMMGDMESYLSQARGQRHDNRGLLEQIREHIELVSPPLQGFQKMTKTLRMLGISTKIESSRLGESGTGFLTLAMDVEKLSQLISEKSANILGHRHLLAGMISDNLRIVRTSDESHDREVAEVLARTSASLGDLISVNERCASFSSLISAVSGEVSANISEVVSSMQMHDMTRQQVEHIVEALERLGDRLLHAGSTMDDPAQRKLVIESGDVCELQSAQLRFASSELCRAVRSIVDNLRDVAGKQALMASESLSTTGVADSGGGSFMDSIRSGMGKVTSVLAACARSDTEMSATLSKMAVTMQEVTGFVTDIEEIGSEIDLIALNSQIKAAHTGREGAALGVLAEAIKRLSVEAITQTESISRTLQQINISTNHLFQEANDESRQLGDRIAVMEAELSGIVTNLGNMNNDLVGLLSSLRTRVGMLTNDIERATAGIDVHERVENMAATVMEGLDDIVDKARRLEPASLEFKDNLRHMEERYTMQSERHIHEAISRKRAGIASPTAVTATKTAVDESEFGDNVELF